MFIMNVIRNSKPISNILPSITHNINLPSKRFQNRSEQTLTASINTKLRHGRCRCPLIQRSLDYNQLQEMAKEIQEESLEDHIDDEDQKEETNKNDDIFASDKKEDQILVWTVDPSRQKRCTCTSGKGLTFQQVLSSFQMCPEIKNYGAKSSRAPRINLLPTHTKSTRFPLTSTISRQRTRNWIKNSINSNNHQDVETPNTNHKEQKSNPQIVLKALHDEFFILNSKYQKLDTQVKNNKEQTTLEALEKLEKMEKELNRKEDEIHTVMSLYRDMLLLKNQVRKLKEQKRASTRLSEHLPKSESQILKQIQTY